MLLEKIFYLHQVSLCPAALQILEKCEHLVATGGEELPDIVPPHVISKILPSFLCSLMFNLHIWTLWNSETKSRIALDLHRFNFRIRFNVWFILNRQKTKLEAASPRTRSEEISEAEWEIFKVDFTVAIMIQVSEYDVTVSLAITPKVYSS